MRWSRQELEKACYHYTTVRKCISDGRESNPGLPSGSRSNSSTAASLGGALARRYLLKKASCACAKLRSAIILRLLPFHPRIAKDGDESFLHNCHAKTLVCDRHLLLVAQYSALLSKTFYRLLWSLAFFRHHVAGEHCSGSASACVAMYCDSLPLRYDLFQYCDNLGGLIDRRDTEI